MHLGYIGIAMPEYQEASLNNKHGRINISDKFSYFYYKNHIKWSDR